MTIAWLLKILCESHFYRICLHVVHTVVGFFQTPVALNRIVFINILYFILMQLQQIKLIFIICKLFPNQKRD